MGRARRHATGGGDQVCQIGCAAGERGPLAQQVHHSVVQAPADGLDHVLVAREPRVQPVAVAEDERKRVTAIQPVEPRPGDR